MLNERSPYVEPEVRALQADFQRCRARSVELVEGVSDADATVQSMEDASPAKWHLAHTTWFFEQFVLCQFHPGYEVFHPGYQYLFNSYYETVGQRQPRHLRGLLSRPSLNEILAYRAHVEGALCAMLEAGASLEAQTLVRLGIEHEQQHQELLLTDLLHLYAQNPLRPALRRAPALAHVGEAPCAAAWVDFPGGIFRIGHDDGGFGFDCEGPVHEVLLRPYALSDRPVTNRDWFDFIAAGGYSDPQWWLADGWAAVRNSGWQAPLYWRLEDNAWTQMSLYGARALVPNAPVCHVSFFEADAFARYSGARLPTEFEWEVAARAQAVTGHFAERGLFRPTSSAIDSQRPLRQLYGGVWEWTASAYLAYPGFKPACGAVGEYNGKFMSGQFVLRGGSVATPEGHVRPSYRNFFYPHQRWQFSGLRLAKDRP